MNYNMQRPLDISICDEFDLEDFEDKDDEEWNDISNQYERPINRHNNLYYSSFVATVVFCIFMIYWSYNVISELDHRE